MGAWAEEEKVNTHTHAEYHQGLLKSWRRDGRVGQSRKWDNVFSSIIIWRFWRVRKSLRLSTVTIEPTRHDSRLVPRATRAHNTKKKKIWACRVEKYSRRERLAVRGWNEAELAGVGGGDFKPCMFNPFAILIGLPDSTFHPRSASSLLFSICLFFFFIQWLRLFYIILRFTFWQPKRRSRHRVIATECIQDLL